MLHLSKLAVGVRDLPHLAELQAARVRHSPPLRHLTRTFPRRAAEVTEGGSLYWVVKGAMVVRQRVLEITEAERDDGTRCTALILDPALVTVSARLMKPFQGWRYLEAAAAPPDVAPGSVPEGMSDALRTKLQELCLI